MRIARKLIHAAILCASIVLSGSVASQAQPQPAAGEGDGDARGHWMNVSNHGASEQAWRLGDALERYRAIERQGGWRKIPAGPAMGPEYFYDCARIAAIERRLIAEGYLRRRSTPPPLAPPPGQAAPRRSKSSPNEPPKGPPQRCRYGPALTAAVSAFQADRKVLGYGQVGALTIAQLNRPVQEIVDILERDLERWRTVSPEPSGTFLLVNIPFFELSVYESGRETMRMPVIVGQPSWQTPTFRAEIEHVILNPDWGIPDRIAKLEYLPIARRDPGYLRRQGITTEGGLRQKPGPRNPLGRIKFVMPNPNDVYLHDTPEKGAFNAAVKALSHGCIRVKNPVELANYLLRDDPQWDPRRLETAVASGKTQQINLAHHMPVHIIYSTSRVNDDGRVELRPDVYGKNSNELPRGLGDESLAAWP